MGTIPMPPPKRRVAYIDVGEMSPNETLATIRQYREQFESNKIHQDNEWHCAYCRTVFTEQRCPTCGAGREER